jgi:predicted dehydrogenase
MQNYRFVRGIRTLRDGIREGRIGLPTFVCVDFFLAPHFGSWRESLRSPLLIEMAIHTFDQARLITGANAVSVYCSEFNPRGSWFAGGAAAVCIFELSDGSVFSYRGSWVAEGCATPDAGTWRISGTLGTAVWDGEGDPVAEVAVTPDQPQFVWPVAPSEWRSAWTGREGHAGCIDEMFAGLEHSRRSETDCTDNIHSLAMVLGAVESARQRRCVSIAELMLPAGGRALGEGGRSSSGG